MDLLQSVNRVVYILYMHVIIRKCIKIEMYENNFIYQEHQKYKMQYMYLGSGASYEKIKFE